MNIEKEKIESKAQEIVKQLNGYTIEEITELTYKIRELSRNIKLLF